jgi:hypothetical protein
MAPETAKAFSNAKSLHKSSSVVLEFSFLLPAIFGNQMEGECIGFFNIFF